MGYVPKFAMFAERFLTEIHSVHKSGTVSVFTRVCAIRLVICQSILRDSHCHDFSDRRASSMTGIERDSGLSQDTLRWYISTCGTTPGRCPRVASLELSAKVRLTCHGTRRPLHRLRATPDIPPPRFGFYINQRACSVTRFRKKVSLKVFLRGKQRIRSDKSRKHIWLCNVRFTFLSHNRNVNSV